MQRLQCGFRFLHDESSDVKRQLFPNVVFIRTVSSAINDRSNNSTDGFIIHVCPIGELSSAGSGRLRKSEFVARKDTNRTKIIMRMAGENKVK